MKRLLWAYFGGILGAVLMDITESRAARLGITSGVNIALMGRWFLGLLRGQFVHSNILNSKPLRGETQAGWAFHFLIGGGVALLYTLLLELTGPPLHANHFVGGLLFGLATSLLPWFILLPSFGWGLCGRRGPEGANALLASTLPHLPHLPHLPYGLGVGAAMMAGLR